MVMITIIIIRTIMVLTRWAGPEITIMVYIAFNKYQYNIIDIRYSNIAGFVRFRVTGWQQPTGNKPRISSNLLVVGASFLRT